ncbi:hypothetical protein [Ferruginibacter sp. HRS2-29]|uniref:hypothetical protein n=1 Tax=Ferruginibacter sp. HRS2-29 TaxID=2487334 RepID=UPI0020CCCC5D|nr:hypothetical protein [Ferruginibacter sp. HRS2-29]MCP9750374.1 hypothetical protein [Ferruginibacter sp. HRS2-29]
MILPEHTQLGTDYIGHKVFKELQYYIEYYNSLAFGVANYLNSGTPGLINLDTHIMSSIEGTLDSIEMILHAGRINDSYALIRKLHDSIIINAYEISYLDKELDVEIRVAEKIDRWVTGTEGLPTYKEMKKYLESFDRLNELETLLKKDDRYKKIRTICNNHMHYNLFQYVMINDNQIYTSRIPFLDQLSENLKDLFVLHFAYLFILRPHYMSSDDYLDHLEADMQPEEGSQYWVAPFIQDAFKTVIKPSRTDIAVLIQSSSEMKLE